MTAADVVLPSGRQFEIALGDQRVVVVEVGGGLRSYAVGGADVLDGYAADGTCTSGRGQVLIPWPNRIEDGRYDFDGTSHSLPLDEVPNRNAIHGLVRWAAWTAAEHEPHRVVMAHVVHPQPGYPFSLSLRIEYSLSDAGLTVHTTATNVGDRDCPYGCGAHPYLTAGTEAVDTLELRIPAGTMLRSDERSLPTGSAPVAGTDYDFRTRRAIGGLVLDNAFTDLERDADGVGPRRAERPGVGRRADAVDGRGVPVRDGVQRRPAAGYRPPRARGRADVVPAQRVSQRREPGAAGARRVAHRDLGHLRRSAT